MGVRLDSKGNDMEMQVKRTLHVDQPGSLASDRDIGYFIFRDHRGSSIFKNTAFRRRDACSADGKI
jgi:hypothetical protein